MVVNKPEQASTEITKVEIKNGGTVTTETTPIELSY